jgi:hypothetical protein
MLSLRRKHRWFGAGFLMAWAFSHVAVVNAQNETPRPTASDKIRRTLDQVIALDYQGNSFNEAIGHLKDRTQLPVLVDQMALQQMGLVDGGPVNVELRNTRGKIRQALQHLLASHNLTYIIIEDSILITTEETALNRQMRQRIPIDLNEVPAGKAIREIARQAGVAIVVDPRVAKAVNQPITLQLEEASVETGLRLIAELVDLKAVRIGNAVFVTDPARADRIRKEEAFHDARGGGVIGPAIDFVERRAIAGNVVVPAAPVPEAPAEKKAE